MSSPEEQFTTNKTQGTIRDVLCVECNRSTKHRVVVSYEGGGSSGGEWSVDWSNSYQTLQCQGCQTVTFRHGHWFSEDWDPSMDQDWTVERFYPKRNVNSLKAEPLQNVPTALRRLYGEVIDCFNNDSLILCAAGLRALVEGLCSNQGVIDGPVTTTTPDGKSQTCRRDNLEGKIAGLHEKGILTTTNAHTLHEHRYLGNDAVHQLSRPSEDELRTAIEIVEHTLEQIYELPQKALNLRQSREKRKQ